MQPPLNPVDAPEAPAKSERCGIWGCDNPRLPERDYCMAHTPAPSQAVCPDCQRAGRGNGAVFSASGVPTCGICGWGRSRARKAYSSARKRAKKAGH